MTRDILNVIKKKDTYFTRWKQNKTNEYYEKQFKHFRNKSVGMLRKAKKQYYSAKIVQQSGDIKQVWKLVREVTGISEKKTHCSG